MLIIGVFIAQLLAPERLIRPQKEDNLINLVYFVTIYTFLLT